LGEIPFEVALLEVEEQPLYQKIASEASQLHRLGMSMNAIAKHLKVDHKSVAKALAWLMPST
jgi:transposase-like protein